MKCPQDSTRYTHDLHHKVLLYGIGTFLLFDALVDISSRRRACGKRE